MPRALPALFVVVVGLLAACGRSDIFDVPLPTFVEGSEGGEPGLDGGPSEAGPSRTDGGETGTDAGDAGSDGRLADADASPPQPDGANPDGGGEDGEAGADAPADAKPTVESVAVAPPSTVVTLGQSGTLVATAKLSDGSTKDVTMSATWASGDPLIATVVGGIVTGASTGTATVTATFSGRAGSASVSVVGLPLSLLRVTPTAATVPVGATASYSATALYVDGSIHDVTLVATWSIDAPTIGQVSAGVVTALAPGTTTVHASFGGLTASASFTVPAGSVVSALEVSPTSPTLGVGTTLQMHATAIYSDGTKADVTTSAAWTSGSPAVASISSGGLASGVSGGTSVVTAAFAGRQAATTLTVTSATVTGITVTPTVATLPIRGLLALRATATYSDGSVVDVTVNATWATSDATVAAVSGVGLVTANTAGAATISAAFGGAVGTASISVPLATLLAITIVPGTATIDVGTTVQLHAIGTYSGGAMRDITADVSWTSLDPSVATVGDIATGGLVTGLGAGKTLVTAALDNVNAMVAAITVINATVTQIVVTPNPTALAQGATQQLTARARYSNGSVQDVTATCIWSSGDATVAAVSNGAGSEGLLTAVGPGMTTAACTLGGVTGVAAVTVTKSTLSQINVSPVAPKCHIGDTINFTAVAIDASGVGNNVTGFATWSSSDATIVQPLGKPGQFRCVAGGTATVSAAYGGKTGSTPVMVSFGVLSGLQVDPADRTIAVGTTVQYVATALYSDGTSANVTGQATWLSSDPTVAQVADAGAKGRATGIAHGGVSISAAYGGFVGSVALTVSTATITAISVSPALRVVSVGTQVFYRASAIYSDGSSRDVTGIVTWTSSTPAVAQVSDGAGKGTAVALSQGRTAIAAAYGGLTGSVLLVVTSATLTSVEVTPFNASAAVGQPIGYRAVAIYGDGTKGEVTTLSTWQSTDSTVAQVSNAARGQVTTLQPGMVTISATYNGVTGTAPLTVTTATLARIQVTPFDPALPVGYATNLHATGIYTDGSTADLTIVATWQSSSPATAAVSNVTPSWGRLVTLAPGTATISATFRGVTGTDPVIVTTATLVSISITPSPASVAAGTNVQLNATGTFSDLTTLDLTAQVTWLSSDTSIADVSNAVGSHGLAYGFQAGAATITAVRQAVKGTDSLVVP